MSGRRSLAWLGLTPEPERELPSTVAALRAPMSDVDTALPALAAAERHRVERLILHGSERGWLRYLAEVTDLVTAVASGARQGDREAALLAGEVVLDHHRMLIGMPGNGYGRTAADRHALETAVRVLRETDADHTDTDTDTTDPSAARAQPQTHRAQHGQQRRQGGRG
ncbi:hypothetical protein [Streptomyces sp. NPDC127084]|uniref:hypothetical protein n=1 Tax=Streptomyces sp. NPDC127084 TaxID=3347133 RepID=UPI00366970A5